MLADRADDIGPLRVRQVGPDGHENSFPRRHHRRIVMCTVRRKCGRPIAHLWRHTRTDRDLRERRAIPHPCTKRGEGPPEHPRARYHGHFRRHPLARDTPLHRGDREYAEHPQTVLD